MIEGSNEDALLTLAARMSTEGADGRAGLRALLREVETRYPGEIERMTASLQLQKIGAGSEGRA